MPQMMPLLWIMNLIYTCMLLNLYIIAIHFSIKYSPKNYKKCLLTHKMKFPTAW